ncbi:endothelin-converting enzyme 2-like [Tubulanus polymorphus]|uniref:endothelin-converting enzyme 2-like n=1 Tax=Tubulanus polymorphus TaxID=672921 RepID=UPI003DA3A635
MAKEKYTIVNPVYTAGHMQDGHIGNGNIYPPQGKRVTLLSVITTVLGILLVMAIIIIILFAVGSFKAKDDDDKICLNEQCIRFSARLLSSMDQSVDPCHDFYRYSCGGWVKKTYLPAHEERVWVGDRRIRRLLFFKGELENDGPNDPEIFQKVRSYYKSCLDKESRNFKGFKPVQELIDRLGGMNVTGEWRGGANWNLTKLMSESFLLGARSIVDLREAEHTKEFELTPAALSFYANCFEIGKPRDIDNQEYGHVVNAIHLMFESIAHSDVGVDVARDAADVYVSLCKKVSELADIYNRTGKLTTMSLTVNQLQNLTTSINWQYFLNAVLPFRVDGNFKLTVQLGEYFKELDGILTKYTPSAINNYILSFTAYHQLRYLGEEVEPVFQSIFSRNRVKENWEDCIANLVDPHHGFVLAMDSIFLRKYMPQMIEEKDEVEDIVERTRDAFIANLRDLDWLDDEAKDMAIDKAREMRKRVLFADILLNDTMLNQFYSSVEVGPEKFFDASTQLTKLCTREIFLTWHPDDIDRPILGAYGTQAYYNPAINEFTIHLGMAESLVYKTDGPRFINYGSLAPVIGHEITHGFDPEVGSLYYKQGVQRTWFSEETRATFHKRSQCFKDQFDALSIHLPYHNETFKVNGTVTLIENIADAGGINAAHRAWLKIMSESEKDSLLPGMPKGSTADKLFFLTLAKNYCVKGSKEDRLRDYEINDHTPKELRVNGIVINSREFAKAYNCPVGSPMNPAKKCKIW